LGVNAGTNGWRIWGARLYQSFFWHSTTWDVKPKLTLEVSNACLALEGKCQNFFAFQNLVFFPSLLFFVAGKEAMFVIFYFSDLNLHEMKAFCFVFFFRFLHAKFIFTTLYLFFAQFLVHI